MIASIAVPDRTGFVLWAEVKGTPSFHNVVAVLAASSTSRSTSRVGADPAFVDSCGKMRMMFFYMKVEAKKIIELDDGFARFAILTTDMQW